MNRGEEIEQEYEQFENEGLDIQRPICDYKKGDELWFQLEAGLPRSGLDPERDTTHISDEELVRVFGKKVQNKGYRFKFATVEQVTALAEELYMPIYQVDSPPNEFIPESFARALVSEVCHGYPMNWSRYAEGVWGRKKGNEMEQRRRESAPTVKYKPVASQMTYESRVTEKLRRECREKFKDFCEAKNELKQLRLTISKLEDGEPINEASIDAMAEVDREISRHKLRLDIATSNLGCAREFLQNVRVGRNGEGASDSITCKNEDQEQMKISGSGGETLTLVELANRQDRGGCYVRMSAGMLSHRDIRQNRVLLAE